MSPWRPAAISFIGAFHEGTKQFCALIRCTIPHHVVNKTTLRLECSATLFAPEVVFCFETACLVGLDGESYRHNIAIFSVPIIGYS